jgi:spermidine/putrescine transport system ATP-binding protein
MAEPLVKLVGIQKLYDQTVAVTDIDISVARGEFVVLLGPSGSGKTTILSILGGFVAPTAGRVIIDGRDVADLPPAQRPTATVFQDYALFPHMNVASNIAFGLAMHKVPKQERQRHVQEVLELVGLEGMGRRGVHELSGGQRQRVALARAIAVQPTVLLLDEPLGALDLQIRRQMQEELIGIQRKIGTTFIHVTHDQDEAMSIADTMVVLNQGRVEDMGSPQRIYRRPATRFVANFMGESNVITARAVRPVEGGVQVDTPLGPLAAEGEAEQGAEVHLSIRPEHIGLGAAVDDAMSLGKATITDVIFQGDHWRCRARGGANGEIHLLLNVPADASVEVGRMVELHARKEHIILLKD